jgi:hypothetical protein
MFADTSFCVIASLFILGAIWSIVIAWKELPGWFFPTIVTVGWGIFLGWWGLALVMDEWDRKQQAHEKHPVHDPDFDDFM